MNKDRAYRAVKWFRLKEEGKRMEKVKEKLKKIISGYQKITLLIVRPVHVSFLGVLLLRRNCQIGTIFYKDRSYTSI